MNSPLYTRHKLTSKFKSLSKSSPKSKYKNILSKTSQNNSISLKQNIIRSSAKKIKRNPILNRIINPKPYIDVLKNIKKNKKLKEKEDKIYYKNIKKLISKYNKNLKLKSVSRKSLKSKLKSKSVSSKSKPKSKSISSKSKPKSKSVSSKSKPKSKSVSKKSSIKLKSKSPSIN